MENEPHLTSPDGSSKRNPPERCPRPLYSRDSTQEDLTIPRHDQSDSKVHVKEEIKEEEDDEDGVMEESELPKGRKDLYQENMEESSSYRNPPERCPRPLYSRDPTQEGHTIPRHDQSGDRGDYAIDVKEEFKEEDEEYGVMKELSEGHTGSGNLRNNNNVKEEHKDEDYGVMEELSGGHKGMMEPPERCPRPLYSRDSTQEDLTIPRHDQSGDLAGHNIDVKEEYKEEDEKYGVMEELSDGHKNVMEPPSSKNPPERCPRPLCSRDPTQEDLTVLHHDQNVNLSDCNVAVKQEFIMDDEEYGVMKELSEGHKDQDKNIMEPPKGHKDLYQENMEESSSYKNPPERCPRPLYSRDPTQEDLTIPHHDQGKELKGIKVEVKQEEEETFVKGDQRSMEEGGPLCSRDSTQEDLPIPRHDQGEGLVEFIKEEETYVRGDRRSTEEVGIKVTGYKKRSSLVISTARGHDVPNTRSRRRTSYPDTENKGKPRCSPRVDSSTQPLRPAVHKKLSVDNRKIVKHKTKKVFPCSECGKSFTKECYFTIHSRTHTGKRPFVCVKCGKGFAHKSSLVRHQRHHSEERPHPCSHCGKGFKEKSALIQHLRSHTGEKPFPCPECGQCFSQNEHLQRHLRAHTGETPFACKQCGKGFTRKDMLALHEQRHVDERPFSCLQCGNRFTNTFCLVRHQKLHAKKRS